MKKRVFYTELAYLIGICAIAFGTVLMVAADFGVSMIVAPAYILYEWLNPYWSFFTFGMAEYCFQGFLIILTALVIRRFKVGFLFSFATAVLYSLILDGFMLISSFLPVDFFWQRAIWYAAGLIFATAGVSLMFSTYISPEAYELLVKELSGHFGVDIHRFKIGYDLSSCLLGIIMSFVFFGFGNFVGVRWGTILTACLNGYVISLFSRLFSKIFEFRDAFAFRSFFEGRK